MTSPLADRTFRHLFAAQIIALAGTGLTTIALALLAYDLAGGDAGRVLGTALALKMVAYLGIAPIVGGTNGISPIFLTTVGVTGGIGIDLKNWVKKVDEEILSLLDTSAVTFQVVLTKADKVKEKDRARILAQVREKLAKHPAAFPEIVLTSSEKGDGIATLRAIVAGLD